MQAMDDPSRGFLTKYVRRNLYKRPTRNYVASCYSGCLRASQTQPLALRSANLRLSSEPQLCEQKKSISHSLMVVLTHAHSGCQSLSVQCSLIHVCTGTAARLESLAHALAGGEVSNAECAHRMLKLVECLRTSTSVESVNVSSLSAYDSMFGHQFTDPLSVSDFLSMWFAEITRVARAVRLS
jgi:hypothetical protein